MAQKDWNAGIIRPVPVAPAGPYQNGAAPGVWTLDQVAYWQKQGLWPIAGNVKPFDSTRILIPYISTTYTASFVLYNWDTNTVTSLGTQATFYPAASGECCNIVIDPSKNIWLFGGAADTTSYKNFMYLAAGSTTPSYYRVVYQNYSSYGAYFSQITWNPSVNKCQVFTYPHYTVAQTQYTFTFSSTGATSNAVSGGPDGWQNPGLALLTTKNAAGQITQGSYIVGVGDSDYNAGNSFIWSDASPWTTPSWSSQSTQIAGNPSRSWVVGLPSNKALVICFSSIFVYVPSSNTWTDVTTTVNNAGGTTEAITRAVTGMWDDVYCLYTSNGIKVVKGDPTGTISWCTSLTSQFTGKTIYMAFGVGKDLYVLTSGTNPWYIAKVTFTDSGTYSITHRALSGLTNTTDNLDVSGLQYF